MSYYFTDNWTMKYLKFTNNTIFFFILFFLLLITWIIIDPAPLFFEIYGILPNMGFASGPLQNPLSSIFSLEGITILGETAYYGTLYPFFYKFYSIVGNGIKERLALIDITILAFTLIPLYQWFRKTNNHLFGIAAMIFFTFTIPVYSLTLALFASPGMTMNLLTITALSLYYFYYRTKMTSVQMNLFFLFLILFFTRASSLVKGEGRLVFPIIFFFLLIESIILFLKTRKKTSLFESFRQLPLFQLKNVCLLLLLFLLCIPIFTLFKSSNIDNGDETPFKVLIITKYLPGLKTFTPITGEGFFHTNYAFYSQLLTKMAVLLRGFGFHTLLFIGFLLALVYFSKKEENKGDDEMSKVSELHTLLLFSSIWFVTVLFGILSQRGIEYIYIPQYVYHSWLYVDYYYVIFPLALFLFTLAKLAYDSLLNYSKNYRKYFSYLIVFFLIINTIITLQWAGGYLDYLAGIHSAKKVIATIDSSASLIVFHQGTLIYNTQVINSSWTDKSLQFYYEDYIFSIPKDCSFLQNSRLLLPPDNFANKQINTTLLDKGAIFIVSNEQMETTCPSLRFFMKMTPTSDTLYYKIKNFFGLAKETYIYKIDPLLYEVII